MNEEQLSDQNMEKVLDQLGDILRKNGLDAGAVRRYMDTIVRKEANQALRESVEKNRVYVGKCYSIPSFDTQMFPTMKKYVKVVSERASDAYHVSCLVFHEVPTYWFNYQGDRIGSVGNYYLGSFEFDGIYVDEIRIDDLGYGFEISDGEYRRLMQQYINELQSMPWYADHYRCGGKWPQDKNWPVNRE